MPRHHPRSPRWADVAARLAQVAALALLALGVVWAIGAWRYQRALAEGESAAAVRLWPQAAGGWRARAQTLLAAGDGAAAEAAARQATALEPADWRNWRGLAEIEVERGELAAARASMRSMLARSRQFAAAWSDANLLYLSGDGAGFWRQAARALAAAPPDRLGPALGFCFAAAGGAAAPLAAAVAAARVEAPSCGQAQSIASGYFSVLLARADGGALVADWPAWLGARCGPPAATERALGARYVLALLAGGDGARALSAWRQARAAGLFPAAWNPGAGRSGGDFDSPVADPFAWHLCTDCGPYVYPAAGALALEFHGQQDAAPALASRWLLLSPATGYRLRFAARAPQATGGGVFAAVESQAGARVLQLPAPRAAGWQTVAGRFATPPGAASYRLVVGYRRPLGQMPLAGTVLLRGFRLEEAP